MAIAEQQPRLPELHRGDARRGAGRGQRACRQVGSAHDDRHAGRAADLAARLRDLRLALARPVVLSHRPDRDRRHGRHARRARRAVPPLDPVAEPVRRRGVRVPGSRRAGAPPLVVLGVTAALRARLPPVAAAVARRVRPDRRPLLPLAPVGRLGVRHRRRLVRLPARLVARGGALVAVLEPDAGRADGRAAAAALRDQLRDLPRSPDGDGHRADPVVRAGRRDVGREARRRPRPGRAEGGDPARRHALAVGRAVRAGRRQARARPAVPGRARHGQDDAGEGDRDGLQLPVRDDPGLRLRADLHRHGRGHRPVPGAQGQAAGAQVGRPVHRLHRRDRRRRHAAPEPRHRPAGSLRPGRQRGRERRAALRGLRVPRPERLHLVERRPGARDGRVARPPVFGARAGRARAPQRHREDRARHVRRAGRRPGAEPAAGRDGRHRQPVVRPQDAGPRERAAGRDVLHPEPRRQVVAADAAGEAPQGADLLHRRVQRPARLARPRAHARRPHGAPHLLPHAHQGRPQGHLRPVPAQGRPRDRPRPREAPRRARAHHERLLAGHDRAGLLDGADGRARRRTARRSAGTTSSTR